MGEQARCEQVYRHVLEQAQGKLQVLYASETALGLNPARSPVQRRQMYPSLNLCLPFAQRQAAA